jgi:hypothetical protein
LFRRTWQSPSNAHAYRLYVFNEPRSNFGFAPSVYCLLAAISEALYSDIFYKGLSTLGSLLFSRFASEFLSESMLAAASRA